MITFREEVLAEVRDEVDAHKEFAQSAIADRTSVPIRIDWNFLIQLETLKLTRAISARHDGDLVGWALFILCPNPIHSNMEATASTVYVHPDHRKFGTTQKLLAFSEKVLVKAGVSVMLCSVVPSSDYSLLLKRRGFELADTVYAKYIN